eukprot:scaffold635_cov535-Prasinococcus_capsulatus_cf.AAC.4
MQFPRSVAFLCVHFRGATRPMIGATASAHGGVSTKVEVVGQQFIRNWNDEANKGKPHDIFTVMLLCTVPDDIWCAMLNVRLAERCCLRWC